MQVDVCSQAVCVVVLLVRLSGERVSIAAEFVDDADCMNFNKNNNKLLSFSICAGCHPVKQWLLPSLHDNNIKKRCFIRCKNVRSSHEIFFDRVHRDTRKAGYII